MTSLAKSLFRAFHFAAAPLFAVVVLAACNDAAVRETPQSAAPGEVHVYVAKKIITMEPAMPEAKVVAIRDGHILGVGRTLDDLEPWTRGQPHVIDYGFADKVLMPGLIDPHLHPIMGAVLLPTEFITPEDWNLPGNYVTGVRTPEAYRKRLADAIAASDATSGKPFITWGYHELWHGSLSRADLDAIEANRPVIVWQRSFHEIIANTAAMAMMGFNSPADLEPFLKMPGVDRHHVSFEDGHFMETGLVAALAKLQPHILSPEHLGEGFSIMQTMLLDAGVTMIADMATGIFADFKTEAAMIENAFEKTGAPVRILMVPLAKTLMAQKGSFKEANAFIREQEKIYEGRRLFMNNRIKLIADGAFFSQFMRMNAPGYTDGHEGKWITEPDELRAMAIEFWNAGYKIHTHVNGDEGLDVVLDILEDLQADKPRPDHRFTLEHLGYSTESQNRRLAELGALVSAQPNYVYVLSHEYARNGMGYDRASQISRLGSLERLGVPLALHSDLTMAPAQPLFLAWLAANRVNMEGNVMAPNERISLDKALRSITIDAAYVLGLEDEIGSIVAGKRADFAVLEEDPMQMGAKGLKDVPVWGVVFEGEVHPRK